MKVASDKYEKTKIWMKNIWKKFLTNKKQHDKLDKLSRTTERCRKNDLANKNIEHWKLNSETTLKILFSYMRK